MKTSLLMVCSFVCVTTLKAQEAGFQLALTPDAALHPRTTFIRGVSLDVWGENPQASLNLGIVNGSTGESGGFSWGFIANYDESYVGVHWALLNYSSKNFLGWQGGLLNISQGTGMGLQSGWINYADEFKGLQFGVINVAQKLEGVQIGIANIALNNPWFEELPNKLATGFPIVNWSF